MNYKEIDPRDPSLQVDKENTCGYCGEPCEKDYCNKDHYNARND